MAGEEAEAILLEAYEKHAAMYGSRSTSVGRSGREVHARSDGLRVAFIRHHRPPDHNPDCVVCREYPGWWKREV
jgi:hypothetical protein